MKNKMAFFVLLAAFAAVVMTTGCAVKVEGVFSDSQNRIVYQGDVANGQQIKVEYRSYGNLRVSGFGIGPNDVKVTSLKGCCGPETVIVSTGGLAVGALIWAVVGGCQSSGFDYSVGPVTSDTRVDVGPNFSFTLLPGEEPAEGEGEPVIEGEVDFVTVPDLSGLTENQARTRISSTCLIVGAVLYVDSDTVPAGRVISWNPTGTVACGTAINLVISTGPEVEGEPVIEGEVIIEGEIEGEPVIEGEGEDLVLVPDLTGLNWTQARDRLQSVGLVDGTISTAPSDVVPVNIVITWSHRGGTVPVGTAIDLVISTGSIIEGEPVEGEIEGEAVEGEIEGEGEFIPMSVKILAPASGQVFEVNTVVNVRVLPKGDPSKGPFRLVVSCAGKKGMSMSKSEIETLVENHLNSLKKGLKNLPTDVIPNVEVGVDHISVFTLTIPGTAYFLSYLEDKDGNYVTDSAAYSVAIPES